MNGVAPEHLVTLTQGATPLQIVTLVILGVIALGVIIGIVKWVIDLKLGTLPADISKINDTLSGLKSNLVRVEDKLWNDTDIRREIRAAIADHMEHCPLHRRERKEQ